MEGKNQNYLMFVINKIPIDNFNLLHTIMFSIAYIQLLFVKGY